MILDDIVAYKKNQIKNEKEITPIKKFINQYKDFQVKDFKQSLSKDNISIIAEIKKASPSKGIIKEDFDPVKIAKVYEAVNIDAVSVLTEKEFFKGNDAYIKQVKEVNSKPILRKDFIIDEYQIYQAKAIGADAILFIAAILGDKLKGFYNLAKEIGLQCLTEVHDVRELDNALEAGCDIIGINNRDLRDFTVSLNTTEEIVKHIPDNIVVVSESGIKTPEDIKYLRALGVNAVLIGETFMRNIDDLGKVNEFISKSRVWK